MGESKVDESISDFLSSDLIDMEEPEHRVRQLFHFAFLDVEEQTDGLITLDELKHAKTIIDIGCGKGAVGQTLRKLGNTGRIIGFDKNHPIEKHITYQNYTECLRGDIVQDPATIERIRKEKPDFIIGMSLPLHVNTFIIQHIAEFGMSPGGKFVLVSEDYLEKYCSQKAKIFHGNLGMDESIVVYEQPA